jgi:DNA repair protein RecN (Recombination protein N)
MLVELRVRNLGVIADLSVDLPPGLTALTGETGAGKTLIVEALELLMGGRADATMVRAGSDEALVEGRFVDSGGEERVLARAVPANGRSRAWLDGRMCPVSSLAEVGAELIDLHGQHAHQSLLRPEAQRAALDVFGKIDLDEVRRLETALRSVRGEIQALGGDARARAREVDLLEYELREIERVGIRSPTELDELLAEEEVLAAAADLAEAAGTARDLVEGAALEAANRAATALGKHTPLAEPAERLRGVAAELDDIATDLRLRREGFEEDPRRLAQVQERRHALGDLLRKYGDTLADVLAFANDARKRLEAIGASEERRAELESVERALREDLDQAEQQVRAAREQAAGSLAGEIERTLRRLAMPQAVLDVQVGGNRRGDQVELLLGANPGEPVLPLAKVASGGELARTMLAIRLVLTAAPPTLVFDEVDAGIGGAASIEVGRALAQIGADHQVLVVTHLAQVAAFADTQIGVSKSIEAGRTVTVADRVEGGERVTELTRMLSGEPDSASGRLHAAELLEMRGRAKPSG